MVATEKDLIGDALEEGEHLPVFCATVEIVAAADQQMSGLLTIGMMALALIFMYFFVVRPQKKQDKEAAEMRNSLRVGDEVTTIGGIIGKVVSIKDPTCIIETGRDGTTIRILKTAIKTVDVPASITIEAATPKKEQSAEEKTEAAPEEAPKKEEKKRGIFGKKK